MTKYAIDLQDIEDARIRIKSVAHCTPIHTSRMINEMAGTKQLVFKCENFQKGGAFKFRGAINAIRKALGSGQQNTSAPHFITHSSGNHAQAVALASQLEGADATVVMPENAPSVKQDAVKGYGARIVKCAATNEARQQTVDQLMEKNPNYIFIHPSDDVDVMSGQGTVALEILEQVQQHNLDVIVVPIGGGGLSAGVAMAVKSIDASIRVVGVEPDGAADAFRSFKARERLGHMQPPTTIADGLRTQLGENNWPILRDFLDEIILVSDDEIRAAMRLIWERMKLVVEPSAATAAAGVLSVAAKELVANKNVAVVLTGGNVDLDHLPFIEKNS